MSFGGCFETLHLAVASPRFPVGNHSGASTSGGAGAVEQSLSFLPHISLNLKGSWAGYWLGQDES